ncbi:hypothetical protein [Streptomyces sp. SID13726]|uniref:hypothetical protein n=1 Tax=Streptomyces sp. SID13726 TaxID=2706058 RepID=UPI0013BD08A0|nr:hypothetical protein [Streptomyces sp. SID13726]NEB05973.1 hypothetical protein [Streptomyces sp. SID13726]
MLDVFALITERFLRDCGEEPVCTHVGDVQVCAIKSHPTYQVLRKKVRLGRSKSVASLRLWESVGTLAREGNQREREKWLMVLLDLLTPYFRGWPKDLARKWRYDVSDIRSTMMESALETWFSLAGGMPAKKLLDVMLDRAFTAARALVEAPSAETCGTNAADLVANATHEEGSALCASSIIDASSVRDPDANERIRGECLGALLQRMGVMSHVEAHHEKIRSGRRNEKPSPVITPSQMGRVWVDGKNLYYRISEILPQYIGFSDAARIFDLSESQVSKMTQKGTLPFGVLWSGNSRVVSVKSLMHALGIHDSIVHPDDVENGASHVGGKRDGQ